MVLNINVAKLMPFPFSLFSKNWGMGECVDGNKSFHIWHFIFPLQLFSVNDFRIIWLNICPSHPRLHMKHQGKGYRKESF